MDTHQQQEVCSPQGVFRERELTNLASGTDTEGWGLCGESVERMFRPNPDTPWIPVKLADKVNFRSLLVAA